MKEVYVSPDYVLLVDDCDYDRVMQRSWIPETNRGHLSFHSKKTRIGRFIMNATKGQVIDHRDGNALNNCRSNLRICTQAENARNARKRPWTASKYKGVRRHEGRWHASIRMHPKRIHLGTFVHEIDAAMAYDDAARRLHGEFAAVNFPEESE